MSTKIEFFFTHGHSFTVTDVVTDTIQRDKDIIVYTTDKEISGGDVKTTAVHQVKLHDLKFAVIHYGADSAYAGSTTILHGLATKFDVLATHEEAMKIRQLEAQERETQDNIEYRRQREAEKFVERRKRRSAERKAQREGNEKAE